jgi:hypothetical protein
MKPKKLKNILNNISRSWNIGEEAFISYLGNNSSTWAFCWTTSLYRSKSWEKGARCYNENKRY